MALRWYKPRSCAVAAGVTNCGVTNSLRPATQAAIHKLSAQTASILETLSTDLQLQAAKMASLPWDCLGLILPFLDTHTLRSMSQTCRDVERIARALVQRIRLLSTGALRSAVHSDRFGPAFSACHTLEASTRNSEDARQLSFVLSVTQRCAAVYPQCCARRKHFACNL